MGASDAEWVVLAVIGQPHGVSGRVKLRSFTDPADAIAAHDGLTDEAGTPVKITLSGHAQGLPVVAIGGVTDRTAAELWRGRKLGVPRAAMPDLADHQFYIDDLVGMHVITAAGAAFGTVTAVADYGAGDLLLIREANGREEYYAFTHATFPAVDAAARRITIDPPELLGKKSEESA